MTKIKIGKNKCVAIAKKQNYSIITEHVNRNIEVVVIKSSKFSCKPYFIATSYSRKKKRKRNNKKISKAQKEIYWHLTNVFPDIKIKLNDKNIISPKELDIYIPELKIGIEYDGEYWHYSEWAIGNNSLEKMKIKDKNL